MSSYLVVHTPDVKLIWSNAVRFRVVINNIAHELYDINNNVDVFREVLKRRHASVTELILFLFRIKCSRVVSHQIVRHRIGTYWQSSQRYSEQLPVFILPRSLNKHEVILKIVEQYQLYLKLVKELKINREYARYVLPNCCETLIYCMWNLRELAESIIPLRICKRAQAEFRYIAFNILRSVTSLLPEVLKLKYLAPRCVLFGRCPEYGFDIDKCRSCFKIGLIEALKEHGTEEEAKHAEEIAEAYVEVLFEK